MKSYCVNKTAQANGDHEVHDVTAGLWCLPTPANRIDLGYYEDCSGALHAAQAEYAKVDGCAYCAPGCHSR